MNDYRLPWGWISIGIVLFLCLGIGCHSCQRVDQGNIGLLVELSGTDKGDAKVQQKSGYVFVTPGFERLFEYPTYQQHVEWQEFAVLTKGGLQFDVKPVLNYQIVADSVIDLFKRYRLDLQSIQNGYMTTAVVQVFRDVTNTFDPDSLINNRGAYEGAIFTAVNQKLAPYFKVSQVTSNLTPPKSLVDQIQAKAAAIQAAQAAENQVKVVNAQGEQQVARAKFDSAQKVIHAAADAKVNELQQRTLTPLLIEKMRLEKWDGHYPQVMSGAGGAQILNLGIK